MTRKEDRQMIKVSVFYPNEECKKFDMGYYFNTCIQLVSATLGLEDFRRGFESETFSRTVIEPGFDVC